MKQILIFLLALAPLIGSAQEKSKVTRLLFIFDASNSMNGKWEKNTKISVAKDILSQAVDSLRGIENLELALRIYGHQSRIIPGDPTSQDCNDSKLEVPFSPNSHDAIINKITTVVPKGTTPIALSLEKAAKDFPDKTTNNVIILITDGIEACDGDPCAIATALKAKEIGVKPFVVGLGIDLAYLEKFNCIGTYFDAVNERDFKEGLTAIIGQALNNTTSQVNLNDINGDPSETNVAFTLFDHQGRIRYHYQHTLNHKGNPDTLSLDPLPTYRLVVNTIPPVEKDNIKLVVGEHNIIEVDAPQGYLELKMRGVNGRSPIGCIVRQDGQMQTTHVQYIGETEKYIVGKYDLEVLTLPRLYFDNVEITQSGTVDIEVPYPGTFEYKGYNYRYAAIYKVEGNKREWVYNLNSDIKEGSLELLPGNYAIVYRHEGSTRTLQTQIREFRIRSRETTKLELL